MRGIHMRHWHKDTRSQAPPVGTVWRLVAALGVLALLAGACGDDDDPSATEPATDTSTVTEPAAEPVVDEDPSGGR